MPCLPSSHAAVLRPVSAGVILHWTLHFKDVMHMRVEVAGEAPNGVELVHVKATSVGVVDLVADVKIDNLAEHQAMWAMANRENLYDPAFHANGRLSDTRRLHLHTRHRCETSQREFIDIWGILAGSEIHLLSERIVHYVDHKILRILDILHRILVPALASARGKRQGRRIVAYRHEKTKRCNIGNRVFTDARYPGDGPRHNTANKQFVDRLAFYELGVQLHAMVSFVTSSTPARALVSHVFPTEGNSDIQALVSDQTAGCARCPVHIPVPCDHWRTCQYAPRSGSPSGPRPLDAYMPRQRRAVCQYRPVSRRDENSNLLQGASEQSR